ncbi:hypothetical protein BCR39DRAFT_502991 [Naematelia encephala]|uniref:Uncharacterized protein n=1 Tax=Naematelia encephala TaxID=71784 RepID=A0A1Y2BLZ7_9TREE|nr:hypothetical protein BCR39DRAFT_502991 [Naematelia encephala]
MSMSTEHYVPISTRLFATATCLSTLLSSNGLSNSRPITYLSNKVDRPPEVLSNAILIFTLVTLLVNPEGLASIIADLITYSIGLTSTLSYLRASDRAQKAKNELSKILDFWVVLGGCIVIEGILGRDLIDYLIPLWWVGKVAILGWIMLGSTVPVMLGPTAPTVLDSTIRIQQSLVRSAVAVSTDVGTSIIKTPLSGTFRNNKPSTLNLRSIPRRNSSSTPSEHVPSPEIIRFRNTPDGPEVLSEVEHHNDGYDANSNAVTASSPVFLRHTTGMDGDTVPLAVTDKMSPGESPVFGLTSNNDGIMSDTEDGLLIYSETSGLAQLTESVPVSGGVGEDGMTKISLDQLLEMEMENEGEGEGAEEERKVPKVSQAQAVIG